MSAQDHLSPHQFHLEYKSGQVEDTEVPAGEAQDHWDSLTDGPEMAQITHARWSATGRSGKTVTRGVYGIPQSERAAEPTDDQRRAERHARGQAEMQAASALNDAHDRRENRRSYYQRTGR